MSSWYTSLNRDIPYLRSYRTHNLWLDQYHKKIRTPRITSFHVGVLKRLGKTYSGVSMNCSFWKANFFASNVSLVIVGA